jgi:hypothetical protein
MTKAQRRGLVAEAVENQSRCARYGTHVREMTLTRVCVPDWQQIIFSKNASRKRHPHLENHKQQTPGMTGNGRG